MKLPSAADTAPALLRQAVAGRVLLAGTRCPQPVAARVAALPPNIAPSAIPLPSSSGEADPPWLYEMATDH
jgi:hypothetical protein